MSKGKCAYCAQEVTKNGVTKHLSACAARQAALGKVAGKAGQDERLYHLRVTDHYAKDFWLDLEMRGSATLQDLDDYLRAVWLECCGHLSQFGDYDDEMLMESTLAEALQVGDEVLHIYDFGTSSETMIKAVGVREGRPTTKHPIALMVRNLPPAAECLKCGQPASLFCQECVDKDDTSGLLCAECGAEHPHEDYGGPMELVNSPRMGMCGYDGPAEPPY